MTTAPYIELGFHPTDLRPSDIPQAGAFLGSPAEALEAALAVTRAQVVTQLREEMRGISEPTRMQLLRMADLAWQAAFWKFRKVSAPIIADAYIRAYRAADAGDVPMSLIYDLADKHAEKVGEYFHTSSREALAEGYNTMVNRRIPAKAATDRVLDGYGLTRRQMRAYTSAKQFETPISDVLPRSLKAKARTYIDRAFTTRTRKLSRQEEHNIDEQAKQLAWMWLQDKGRLNANAQKMWITAKDERVCPVCGPLHGKKVGVNDRFHTTQGEFWTPGLHPNCRCVVRLLEHRFAKADWDPKEHPRGGDRANRGRFSRVAERQQPVISTPVIETVEETKKPEEDRVSFKPSEGASMREGRGSFKPGGATWTPSSATWKPSTEATWMPSEGTKGRMTPSEQDEALASMITPKMRMVLDRTTMTMINALESYQKPARRKLESIYRQVLRIQDDAGREYPVYGVWKPGRLNWDDESGRVELDHNVYFTPNKSKAMAEAEQAFQNQQRDMVDKITNSDRMDLKIPRHGRQWRATLEDTDVAQVVGWAAFKGRTADPDVFFDDTWEVEVTDQGGNRMTLEMPYSELARHLGVSPDDFDVRIMRMDEGHDSADGTTVMLNAGTKGGYEDWVTSGVYKATKVKAEDVGHNVILTTYFIDPDAKEHRVPFD